MQPDEAESSIKPSDLRGILNYVPRFLGQTFVVALDGSMIEHENLPNVLLDVAVLRSLQIHVVVVHGIGKQLRDLAERNGVAISDIEGSGPTDAATLDLGIRVSSRVSHQILEALTKAKLKCSITNAVRAKAVGVIKGVDHQFTGRADHIDAEFLRHLIAQSILPIIQPIGFDRNGHTLRINSDALAIDIAIALGATKVLFLTEGNGFTAGGELRRQIPVADLETMLGSPEADALSRSHRSKAAQALRGVKSNIARVHILDGRIHDGLIREVFSNEGVGTLIYGNEYQQIRKARRDDVALIYHLTRSGVAKEELLHRSMHDIERKIDDFYVYEIDGNIMACVLLDRFADQPETREMCSLFVHPIYQSQGIGRKLVNFVCQQAQAEGARRIVALSTQNYQYFKSVFGFDDATPDILPPARRERYEASARKSKVLCRELSAKEPANQESS